MINRQSLLAVTLFTSSIFAATGVSNSYPQDQLTKEIGLPERSLLPKAPQPLHKKAWLALKRSTWQVVSNPHIFTEGSSVFTGMIAGSISKFIQPGENLQAAAYGFGAAGIMFVITKALYEYAIAQGVPSRIYATTEDLSTALLLELEKDISLTSLKSVEDVVLYCSNKYPVLPSQQEQRSHAKLDLQNQQRTSQLLYQATVKGIDQARLDGDKSTEEGLLDLQKNIISIFRFITQKLNFIIEYEKQQFDRSQTDKREISIKGLTKVPAKH